MPGVDHGFRGAGATPTGLNEALLRWVEEGQAPEKLMAEKRDASGKVIRTRPLFPYPAEAIWNGAGDTNSAANFSKGAPSTGRRARR